MVECSAVDEDEGDDAGNEVRDGAPLAVSTCREKI